MNHLLMAWAFSLSDFPQSPYEALVFRGTIFAILLVCGIYFVLKIRRGVHTPDVPSTDEQLLVFSKYHEKGALSKEEYGQVKRHFADVFQEEDDGKQKNSRDSSEKKRRR